MSAEIFYIMALLLMSSYSIIIYNKPTETIKSDRLPVVVNHTTSRTGQKIKTDSTMKIIKKKQKFVVTKTAQHTEAEKIQEQKNRPVSKTVTVKNNITTDMLVYKHWSGVHEPSFILTVNGKKIEQGEQIEVPAKNNILEVRYDYSFAKGMRKGAKIISCNIEKDAKDVGISFSWNSEWNIKTDHAQPQKEEIVAFSG